MDKREIRKLAKLEVIIDLIKKLDKYMESNQDPYVIKTINMQRNILLNMKDEVIKSNPSNIKYNKSSYMTEGE